MAEYTVGPVMNTADCSAGQWGFTFDVVNMSGDIWATVYVDVIWPTKLSVATFRMQGNSPEMDGSTVRKLDSQSLNYGTAESGLAHSLCKLTDTLLLVICCDNFFGERLLYTVVEINASGMITWQTAMNGSWVYPNYFTYMSSVLVGTVNEARDDNPLVTAPAYMVAVSYCAKTSITQHHQVLEIFTYEPAETKPRLKSARIIPGSQGAPAADSTCYYPQTILVSGGIIMHVFYYQDINEYCIESVEISTVDPIGTQTVKDTLNIGAYQTHDIIECSHWTGFVVSRNSNYVYTITCNSTTGALALVDSGAISGTTLQPIQTVYDIGNGYYAIIGGDGVITFEIDNSGAINTTQLDQRMSMFDNTYINLGHLVNSDWIVAWEYFDGPLDFKFHGFYFGSEPAQAVEHTEFVTSIVHRWKPGSYTMELMLGGLEDAYIVPRTSLVDTAKQAISDMKGQQLPGKSIEEYVRKVTEVPKPVWYNPGDPSATAPVTSAAAPEPSPPIWLEEKGKFVERAEYMTRHAPRQVQTALRLWRRIFGTAWRRQ